MKRHVISNDAHSINTNITKKPKYEDMNQQCPYLATIDRKAIDFDQAPTCSETLSTQHVYACLICGKYLSGRGTKTPAFRHSLDVEHHVFIHLQSGRFYCLPDDYEIHDESLQDISFNLHPRFQNNELDQLMDPPASASQSKCRALDGNEFVAGLMGIDNIKKNDWLNVIVQMMQTVHPIIKSFILKLNDHTSAEPHKPHPKKLHKPSESKVKTTSESLLVSHVFAEFCAKLWNPRAFRSHVNPHQLIESMSLASNRSIKLGEHTDPVVGYSFLINLLHRDMTAGVRSLPSVITNCLQGELLIETMSEDEQSVVRTQRSHFFHLSLKLPPAPLFAETDRRTILPSIPLTDLLAKFNRQTIERDTHGVPRRFSILSLPKYLVVHYQRFNDNTFMIEKNPTLITFPLTNLSLKSLVNRQVWEETNMQELVAAARQRNLPVLGEKSDLIDEIIGMGAKRNDLIDEIIGMGAKRNAGYDCYANIVHEGTPQKGFYHIHVRRNNSWFDIQDAKVVTSDTMHQTVLLSESYMQLYRRVDDDIT